MRSIGFFGSNKWNLVQKFATSRDLRSLTNEGTSMVKLFDGCHWLVGFEEIVSIADCRIGTLVQSLTQLPERGVSVLPKSWKGQPDDH